MIDLFLAAAAALQSPVCSALPGWKSVAERSAGKYLVLGEMHGSSESPEAVADYVCAVAEDGPVLLAIEFSSTDNADWQRAWSAPHSRFREILLGQVEEWNGREDGVASEAMLAMLVRLHALKEAGLDIDVVAFNGANGDAQRAAFAGLPGQEPHEAAQAVNIRAAAGQRDYAHMVVLVGNLHARKTPTSLGPVTIRPMAMLLAGPERVVSLDMHTDGGETWGCQLRDDVEIDPAKPITDDMIACAAHRTGPSRPQLSRGFHLEPRGEDEAYDGVFALGPVTASQPAVIE